MSYPRNASNSCCLSSLASAFNSSGENNAAKAIEIWIEESLHCQYQSYKDKISFADDIMSDQVKNPGGQRLHYNINKWVKVPIWDSLLHQLKRYLCTVNGHYWQY